MILPRELIHPKNAWLIFKICIIINGLKGVWLDTYILQITWKIEKLFGDELDFEDIKLPVKIKDIHKIYRHKYFCLLSLAAHSA